MGKRTTKAEVILSDMRKRVEVVERAFTEHTNAAQQALETLTTLRQIYADLERSLAPKSRGKSTPAPSVEKKSSRKSSQAALVPSTEADKGNALSASNGADA